MNKKTISLAVLGAVAMVVAAQAQSSSPFSGAYAGIAGRYTVGSAKTKYTYTSGGSTSDEENVKKNRSAVAVDLLGGYGSIINGFYLGGELGVSIGNASYKQSNANGALTFTYKTGPRFLAAVRLGYLVTPNVLGFISLGGQVGQAKLSAEYPTTSVSGTSKKNNIAFTPGVGVEVATGNNMLVRLDYTYVMAKKMSASFSNAAGTKTLATSVKPSEQVIRLGVSYKF